jgi:hypothetical protein
MGIKRWCGIAKSVALGRLYYEDGTSDRWPRLDVWVVLGPHPIMWLSRQSWATRREECGCGFLRGTKRRLGWSAECLRKKYL